MSTDATTPSAAATANGNQLAPTSSPAGKGKGKQVHDDVMDEDEEEEEEDEEEEDEDEEMAEEDDLEEIDPSVIITSSRRTRGVRVDYSSAEALAKAGLKPEEAAEDDENEESFVAPDNEMRD
ncbi:hypothetical protein L226DRAFT_532035 [Lentinus tigrinus ALCF2SS1-7]|uniref:Histone chaperone domain-containing protein n=1 Tax=Lentinus tigrinus ALCF2SS1-6 TaxID=1328759 RepID=A0A5C2S243_9APHY|nr:hypothetical protein L227DRAFT_602388 [Lentinus tigrinus ALCF2SS1-6]RPD78714.1 hypothetical protein L226DRAFT_532035 [Lentinus tigrinus ALCF2SS1-7]